MLIELRNARQIAHEPARRWFTSPDMDLVVWLDEGGRLIGFQLCYDKHHQEKALTWRGDGERTLSHAAVDSGEASDMKYKASPVLLDDSRPDLAGVAERFRREAGLLPPDVATFVLEILTTSG